VIPEWAAVAIAAGAAVMVFGLTGAGDYDAEHAAAAEYRENVCAGTWPDFKDLSPRCD
jgi:hypothetical protein